MISAATLVSYRFPSTRPIGLDHAAFWSGWAGELGDPRPPHDDLRRHDLERFLPVEAEYFPLAVRRACLEMGGHRQLHFVAREVGGELFVAGLFFCLLAALVALNRFLTPHPRSPPRHR
jgi:hypothetical protein